MPAQEIPNDYPIELTPPDITPYKTGNTGIDYITRFDSGKAGPHVMITAVVHGNELCGAIALDWLFRHNIAPVRGVVSLGFMNIEAYHLFDPQRATASRFVDEDFNRLWRAQVLDDGERDSVELRRARQVRPYLDSVDLLLDIHSMQEKTPPLMMAGPLPKGRRLAKAVGDPVQQDQGQRPAVTAQRQHRPGAATHQKPGPGDAVRGHAETREAPPDVVERWINQFSQARVQHGFPYAGLLPSARS